MPLTMRRPPIITRAPRRLAMLGFVGAVGCTSLAHVHEFATAGRETTVQFPPLATDFAASCVRAEGYNEEVAYDAATDRWHVHYVSDSELVRNNPACQSIQKASPGILAANDILGAYLEALARLSQDKVVNYDTASFSQMVASVEQSTGVADSIGAVSALAQWAASAFTSGYRQAKLRDAVVANNDAVHRVTHGLQRYTQDYEITLDAERQRLATLMAAVFKLEGTHDPAAQVLAITEYRTKLDRLAARQHAAQAYIAALDKIAAGHQKLHDNASRIGANEIVSELVSYATSLAPLVAQMHQVY